MRDSFTLRMISTPTSRLSNSLFAFGNMYSANANRRINERAVNTGSGMRIAFQQIGSCTADEDNEEDRGDDDAEVIDA